MRWKNGERLSYLHRDQLGPLRTVTDAAGALGKRSTYRPFGGITDFNVAPAVAAETKGFVPLSGF